MSKFRQVDDYDSSTRYCPCGGRITWSGADPALATWMQEHATHGQGVVSFTSEDGERAYASGARSPVETPVETASAETPTDPAK